MNNVNYRANDNIWVVDDLMLSHHIKIGHCQHANTYVENKWHGHLQCTGLGMWGVDKSMGWGSIRCSLSAREMCVPSKS